MRMAAKIILLSLSVFLLAVCSLQAKESETAAPPIPQVSPPDEAAVAPPAEKERFIHGEEYLTGLLEKIKKADPNEGARLEKLRGEDPQLFRKEIRKVAQEHGIAPAGFEAGQPRGEAGMEGDGRPPMGMMGREKVREHIQARENLLTAWLEKNEPAKAKELAALKEKDPQAYMRRMAFEMKKYREIIDTEQTNPALAEVLKKDLALKQKQNELLEKLKGITDEKQKEEPTKQLKEIIGQRFDLIVQEKQLKYEELKKQLQELQQSVNKSQSELENIKSKKAEHIDKRLQELLSQSEKLNWD